MSNLNFEEGDRFTYAESKLLDRDGKPLRWVIFRRGDGTCSIESSDFALLNFVEDGMIATYSQAIAACNAAEKKIIESLAGCIDTATPKD